MKASGGVEPASGGIEMEREVKLGQSLWKFVIRVGAVGVVLEAVISSEP